jgi:hypothetical protein
MTTDYNFFVTSMPDSRPADYYLGCLDGCVFIDFNNKEDDKVYLTRISFDGYGCCNLKGDVVPLCSKDSADFKKIVESEIQHQNAITTIIKIAIGLNKKQIWTDALEEYNLI